MWVSALHVTLKVPVGSKPFLATVKRIKSTSVRSQVDFLVLVEFVLLPEGLAAARAVVCRSHI